MRPIDQEFIDTIARFNEKSDIRFECGKKRRKIEKEYRALLEETTQNINDIDEKDISNIKRGIKLEDDELKKELKDVMLKNGEKEKEPFDSGVVENSIIFGEDIYKQEASILIEVYDKTNSLLDEINNNSVKIKKYKKLSKDVKNKVEFINAEKEYLTQFLDNERLSVGLGKKEHKKLMKEACTDFQNDTEQMKNLNELVVAEISGEADNRKYEDLYKADYLYELQKKEIEFEKKLGKLNLVGKILNPINWRIEGIGKIYSTFDNIVTNEYERDLSKYKINEDYEETDDFYLDERDEEEIIEKEKPKKTKPKKAKKEKLSIIDEEIKTSNDVMGYYDNLNQESEYEDEDELDDDFEISYPNYKDDIEEYEEDKSKSEYDDDDFESNFYRTFYNEDDDFYDNEDDDIYDDLETILKNRKKRASRTKARKNKSTRKKGIFGLGNKNW